MFGVQREQSENSLFRNRYGSSGPLFPDIDPQKAINGDYNFVRWPFSETERPVNHVDVVPDTSQQTGNAQTEFPLQHEETGTDIVPSTSQEGGGSRVQVEETSVDIPGTYSKPEAMQEPQPSPDEVATPSQDGHTGGKLLKRRVSFSDENLATTHEYELFPEEKAKKKYKKRFHRSMEDTFDRNQTKKYLKEKRTPETEVFYSISNLLVGHFDEQIVPVESFDGTSTSGLEMRNSLQHLNALDELGAVKIAGETSFKEENCFAMASTDPPADAGITFEPVSIDTAIGHSVGSTEDYTTDALDLSRYTFANENPKPKETVLDSSELENVADELPGYACSPFSEAIASSSNMEGLNPQFICDARFNSQPFTYDLPNVIQADRENDVNDSFLFEGYNWRSSDHKPDYERRSMPRTVEEYFSHNREFKESLAFSLDYEKDIDTYEQAKSKDTSQNSASTLAKATSSEIGIQRE